MTICVVSGTNTTFTAVNTLYVNGPRNTFRANDGATVVISNNIEVGSLNDSGARLLLDDRTTATAANSYMRGVSNRIEISGQAILTNSSNIGVGDSTPFALGNHVEVSEGSKLLAGSHIILAANPTSSCHRITVRGEGSMFGTRNYDIHLGQLLTSNSHWTFPQRYVKLLEKKEPHYEKISTLTRTRSHGIMAHKRFCHGNGKPRVARLARTGEGRHRW